MIAAARLPRLDVRHRRIVKAVSSAAAARVLTSAISLVTLPLCLRYLGAERFGVWATVTTTAVWINLLDLGIGNTLTNHISEAFACDEKEAARRYFTSALFLTMVTSGVAGGAFALLFRLVDWSTLLNLGSSVNRSEVGHTIVVAVILTLLGLPCSLAAKLLAGYQQLHRYGYASAAGALGSLLGLATGISLHVRMPALYAMSLGCIPVSQLLLLLATLWEKRWLVPRLSAFNVSATRELLGSGLSFLLIQVAAVVVFSCDNVIVSHYLGPAQVTPYAVTWRLAGLAAMLQSLLFPAVWPAYAEAYAAGDYRWIRSTFASMMRGVAGFNLLCAALLVLLGTPVIRIWAGAAAIPSTALLCTMALWAVINGIMSVESCLLAALNRVRLQAVLSIVAAAVNVALSIALVQRVGAVGVIAGTVLSYLIVLVGPQTMIVREVWRRELCGGQAPLALPCFGSRASTFTND